MKMLPKYWRLHFLNDTGVSLVHEETPGDDALIACTSSPWKLVSGAVDYGTAIDDDFGFDSSVITLADGASLEGAVHDNTTLKHFHVNGYLYVQTSDASAIGSYKLYIEGSEDNTNWPSDSDDFSVTDLDIVKTMLVDASGANSTAAINFEI